MHFATEKWEITKKKRAGDRSVGTRRVGEKLAEEHQGEQRVKDNFHWEDRGSAFVAMIRDNKLFCSVILFSVGLVCIITMDNDR